MLDLKSGDYFRLNQTGSLIWSDITTPATFSDLLNGFINRFDVDQATLDADLKAVLSVMLDKGLVVINPR
ncbi:PqqD family protein [Asticcacaulis sp. 201]|uniref:PqqD family protein n=1 Tax=Asticcacaulis sp. 201 TaxID=3028787 RepID=UPI0039834A81